jgi:hypothetical protein
MRGLFEPAEAVQPAVRESMVFEDVRVPGCHFLLSLTASANKGDKETYASSSHRYV